MKKTVFALFAVLLVLFLASCDLFTSPTGAENDPKFTDDGREMVRLAINVGGNGTSRAISQGQASNLGTYAVNFYEVVFYDGTYLYRRNWKSTDPGPIYIDVPEGDYTGEEKAVVFAGYKDAGDDSTLLAVGIITAVNGISLGGSPANIVTTDNSVTFTLSALVSAVTDTVASSFHILGPANGTTVDFRTTTGGSSTYLTNPAFVLPPSKYYASVNETLTANTNDTSLNVTTLNTSVNIVGRWNFNYPYYKGIKTKGSWVLASDYADVSEVSTSPKVKVQTIARFPSGTNTIVPSDGNFYFNFSMNPTDVPSSGFGKVSITVPVVAIRDDSSPTGYDTPVTWNIRGGALNSTLDDGTGSGNGGAVLLYVDNKMATLIVDGGF